MLRWPAEALWQAVVPLVPAFTVEVLPTVDSTNSELMRRARGGAGSSRARRSSGRSSVQLPALWFFQ